MEDKKTQPQEITDAEKTIVMPLYMLSDRKEKQPITVDEANLANKEEEVTTMHESQEIQDMVVNEQTSTDVSEQKEIPIQTQQDEINRKEEKTNTKPTLEEKRKPKTTQTIEEKRKEQRKDALTLEEKRKKQFENKMTLEEKRALQAKGQLPTAQKQHWLGRILKLGKPNKE